MAAEHADAGAEPAPQPDGVTADQVDELPGAAPDEATDAAQVEATLGDPVTPVVDDPEAGPTSPLGEDAAVTDAADAGGATPGTVDEQAPADEHVEVEQVHSAESPADSTPEAAAEEASEEASDEEPDEEPEAAADDDQS